MFFKVKSNLKQALCKASYWVLMLYGVVQYLWPCVEMLPCLQGKHMHSMGGASLDDWVRSGLRAVKLAVL